jgi:hypothetical protein
MNVFVLSTGRAGSTTFAKACAHITNYTSGHESRRGTIGSKRLEYPANHIESDNRLSWLLGRLHERYGDDAFYVHLIRDREATARSFDVRWEWHHSIIRAYVQGILCSEACNQEACLDYWDTVNANIRIFIAGRPRAATVRLEHAAQDFATFWDDIGAEGNKEEALRQWSIPHNATQSRKPHYLKELGHKALRIKRRLPSFLRET